MTIEIACVKRNGGFFPVDQESTADVAAIAEGTEGLLRFRQPRNVRQHRLAWALAAKLAETYHNMVTKRQMMNVLLEETGHYDVWVHPTTAELRRQPHSVAFASMKQNVFDEFLKAAIDFALREILPGVSEGELKREIGIMVGAETIEDNLTENDRG